MRLIGLILTCLLLWGCGSGGGGTGGTGGEGGSGGGLEGDAECVEAQEYINGEPCASDADITNTDWQVPLTGCMDDGSTSKLCVNCIKFQKHETHCILNDDCASQCAAVRQ